MKNILDFLKEELKSSKKIKKEDKRFQTDFLLREFWKGRIYTLKRCIRKLEEGK